MTNSAGFAWRGRGLLLHCIECGRPSFIGIDDAGQRYDCPRCGARNHLAQARWRQPDGEPLWFYDLHSSFRELLSTGGQIPLLTAAALRSSSRTYSDCAELEFFDDTGAPIAEIDLIAHVDHELVVAEAKTSTGLGATAPKRAESARKISRIAEMLRADVVLLASSAPAPWSPATVAEVESALKQRAGALLPASVRTLTGL